MKGKRFGRLLVIEKAFSDNGIHWLCQCDCGNEKVIRTGHLNAGTYSSCGCDHFHGHGGEKRTREYISYHNMMTRCHKPSNNRYKDYGAVGITVCDRWKDSFQNFISDMGECPDEYQIDRIDNTQGYSPDNCRWASRSTNMRNRRGTYRWFVDGNGFESASEAAQCYGVSTHTISLWCGGGTVNSMIYPQRHGCYREQRYD
jgi:hypothetical protein